MTRLQQKTSSDKPPSEPIAALVTWPNGQAQKPRSVSDGMVRLRAGRFREGAAILGDRLGVAGTMRTKGEIEAAICQEISRFEEEYIGRGPKDMHTYLLGDFVVVRLQDLLTPAEQQLAKTPSEKGRDLLKQVRTHLIETARPLLQEMVQEITGVKVVSLYHDISTVTGEEVVLFTLAQPPLCRPAKNQ
jgi:uncharacterized protein YbcI